MDIHHINAYVERAREIVGDRSQGEIDYDNAVVAHLSTGMDVKRAIAAANERHPTTATCSSSRCTNHAQTRTPSSGATVATAATSCARVSRAAPVTTTSSVPVAAAFAVSQSQALRRSFTSRHEVEQDEGRELDRREYQKHKARGLD